MLGNSGSTQTTLPHLLLPAWEISSHCPFWLLSAASSINTKVRGAPGRRGLRARLGLTFAPSLHHSDQALFTQKGTHGVCHGVRNPTFPEAKPEVIRQLCGVLQQVPEALPTTQVNRYILSLPLRTGVHKETREGWRLTELHGKAVHNGHIQITWEATPKKECHNCGQ